MLEGFTEFLTYGMMQIASIYLTGVAGVLIGFPLVKLGHHNGKLFGDKKFKSQSVLFVGVIISIVITGAIFEWITPYIPKLLEPIAGWVPLICILATLALYGWFTNALDEDIRWKIVAILAVLAIINVIINLAIHGYFFNVG